VVSSRLIARIDDHLVETTLTTVLAFGAYLVAEEVLHVSGVLAVVAAGLATGNITPKGMSAKTKIITQNFWEFAAFLANSFAFLLIGLQIDLALLWENIDVILWAILAVLVARAVSVYGLSWVGRGISLQWKNVLFWGGLRGAISLALALSLTPAMPHYEQLQVMAFGVVLFTLLVKGLTMEPLIKRLGLVGQLEDRAEYENSHARMIAFRAAQARLEEMHANGLMSDFTWQKLKPWLAAQSEELTQKIRQILDEHPGLHEQEMKNVWREAVLAQRSSIQVLSAENIISSKTYSKLAAELDAELDKTETSWSELSHL
jgi:CPA1 family monovalent cation:H+ antiporter